MKLPQLIEYTTWEISFLKNHTQNVMEKLVPDPFIKNQNLAYLWINSLNCYKVYCISKSRSTKYIKTSPGHLILPYSKLFWKRRRSLKLVSLLYFLHEFWKKNFSCYILLTDQISLSDCLYFLRYWAICVLQLFLVLSVTS